MEYNSCQGLLGKGYYCRNVVKQSVSENIFKTKKDSIVKISYFFPRTYYFKISAFYTIFNFLFIVRAI